MQTQPVQLQAQADPSQDQEADPAAYQHSAKFLTWKLLTNTVLLDTTGLQAPTPQANGTCTMTSQTTTSAA